MRSKSQFFKDIQTIPISVFMSENGWDCVDFHREEIMKCVNKSVPELFDSTTSYNNIHLIVFSRENCRKGASIRHCVEKSLLKCSDPTPSNVVNSLLLSMQKATPCKGLSASYTSVASSLIPINFILTLIVIFPWIQ